jgi:hypothetical protein
LAELLDPTSEDLKILAGFPSSASDGGLAVGNSVGNYVDLPVGTNGQVLTLVAGQPAWQTSTGAGHVIQEEGASLPQRTNLNFIGTIVTASDDAGMDKTDVTIVIPALHVTNAMLAGSIDNSKLLTNPLDRANHTGTQLASTISDFDTQVRTSRLDQMAIPTALVDFNNQTLSNLGPGTISALTEELAPTSGDFLLVLEAGSNAMRKVDIGNLPTGGGGENNTGANVGTGLGVFRDKTGVTLNFNSLIGGTGIDITNTVDDLTIAIDGTVTTLTGTQTLTNKTLTLPIIGDFTNATHDHENPAGGGNIAHTAISDFDAGVQTNRLDQMAIPTATVDFNNQTLSNLGTGTISSLPQELVPTTGDFILVHEATSNAMRKVDIGNLPSSGGEANTGANVGTGVGVFRDKTGVTLNFNSLIGGTGIDVTDTTDDITIAIDSTVVTLTGTQILSNKTLTLPEINDLSADHQYVFVVSELLADRNVTLPALAANDTFVFQDHTQVLQNKSIDADLNTLSNIDNGDIKLSAGILFQKLEPLASANLLVGSAGNVPTSVAITGDVTISNTGVTSIASGVIVNADINTNAAIDVTKLAIGTAFQRIRTNAGATANEYFTESASVSFVLDGGGSAISTGIKGHIEVPFDCEIVAARLFADQTGSIVVDINRDTFANYPPTGADSITGAAPPTISSSDKSEDTTLTGWTTVLSQGDILQFEVDSAATITFATLSLTLNKRG